MSAEDDDYFSLSTDGAWIECLRVRLPYSFERIETKPGNGGKIFVLSGPMLREGAFSATVHSFWKRGHMFYMAGKLLDCHSMAGIWNGYRMQIGLQQIENPGNRLGSTALDAFDFYNSMQLEKLWRFTHGNVLDRERVMMTNLAQALELCLKAMITHAGHLETERFEFPSGHKITDLYRELPAQLRDEIAAESRVFADAYAEHRARIEHEVGVIWNGRTEAVLGGQVVRAERDRWEAIADELNDSDYTVFVNSNDPGASLNQRRDDWFDHALDTFGQAHGFGDELQYYRYAPKKDADELPTDQVEAALLLGRFLYEHLFPMPTDPDAPIVTRLLT